MAYQSVDYIIIGQGIAGSCLALQAMVRFNKRVVVLDAPNPNSATRVAAGLFNPITGRKMTKTWMADELFPYLSDFYSEAERITRDTFFFPMPVYRPLVSMAEQNEWMGRSALAEYENWVRVFPSPQFVAEVKNPYGGVEVKHAGWLNTQAFLAAVQKFLEATQSYAVEQFDERQLIFERDQVCYHQWKAAYVVYCTGTGLQNSIYFGGLPIQPLKGETLEVNVERTLSAIYNRGVFIVPQTGQVGSTYDPADRLKSVTTRARESLSTELAALLVPGFSIKNQRWGFRPTVPDRRPILGRHAAHPNLVVFGGLGTKGISLAPYFAGQLISYLEKGEPVNKSVAIERYKSVYWKSA
jgi:glycine/D-amino acid oxidase-like deaminating enzyme